MTDDEQTVHDLRAIALRNKCYLGWAASGLVLGSVVKPGVGTVVGFLGGILWGVYTCKPIAQNAADRQRFISESDFVSFHRQINVYHVVSRDEAFALAALVSTQGIGTMTCAPLPNAAVALKSLLSSGRA